MNLLQPSRQPVSMRRISWTLAITFGVFIITSILLIVLPLRSTGPVSYLRFILSGAAFIFGVAWAVLSLLAIPRTILFLAQIRKHEPAANNELNPEKGKIYPLPAGRANPQGEPFRQTARQRRLALPTLKFLDVKLTGFIALFLSCFPVALCVAGIIMISMSNERQLVAIPPLTADQCLLRDELKIDVFALAGTIGDRNVISRYNALCAAADYIDGSLSKAGYQVRRQGYEVDQFKGRRCYNLEVEIRGTVHPEDIVVVGAHYDSVEGVPGANDNASGVAAMLAIARAFAGTKPERTLRFVAFVNEEPPFFWTRDMGSRVYARQCKARHERIVAMLSLETLGYYSDEKKSQRYPLRIFNLFYPTTGNFIGFIGNIRSYSLVKTVAGSFRQAGLCPSEFAALPGWITGVSWSDHWAFWQEGYPAIMVTDTALFRYQWYHTPEDTPEKLNYDRFALAVAGLNKVVGDLAFVKNE